MGAARAFDPPANYGGRRKTHMRAAMNAIFYPLRSGCPWRYLPREGENRKIGGRYAQQANRGTSRCLAGETGRRTDRQRAHFPESIRKAVSETFWAMISGRAGCRVWTKRGPHVGRYAPVGGLEAIGGGAGAVGLSAKLANDHSSSNQLRRTYVPVDLLMVRSVDEARGPGRRRARERIKV